MAIQMCTSYTFDAKVCARLAPHPREDPYLQLSTPSSHSSEKDGMSAEPSEDVPVWAHVDWLSSGTRAGLVVAFMAAAMANAAGEQAEELHNGFSARPEIALSGFWCISVMQAALPRADTQ